VERLVHGGVPVALLTEVGDGARPRYCLNACLDTAPIGSNGSWTAAPFEGTVVDGWLVGRGSADSKVAASILAHLAVELHCRSEPPYGTAVFLWDADEHSGSFGGIKSFLGQRPHPDGVMIGYPGNSAVLIGARGFWRARLTTHGTGEHSGRRGAQPQNAIVKAAALIDALSSTALPAEADPFFRFGPRLSVTGVQGGNGYSTIPDACVVRVDVRLTPSFGAADAKAVVRDACAAIDRRHPTREPTRLDVEGSWPAYRLPEDSHLVASLQASASHEFGRVLPMEVAGPSNAGNYLASCGVPATCGLGVTYGNLHAADERIEVSSILSVYRTYRRAVLELLGPG